MAAGTRLDTPNNPNSLSRHAIAEISSSSTSARYPHRIAVVEGAEAVETTESTAPKSFGIGHPLSTFSEEPKRMTSHGCVACAVGVATALDFVYALSLLSRDVDCCPCLSWFRMQFVCLAYCLHACMPMSISHHFSFLASILHSADLRGWSDDRGHILRDVWLPLRHHLKPPT